MDGWIDEVMAVMLDGETVGSRGSSCSLESFRRCEWLEPNPLHYHKCGLVPLLTNSCPSHCG